MDRTLPPFDPKVTLPHLHRAPRLLYMNLSSESPQGTRAQPGGTPVDPRLQPTPDYGTLGPGSDVPISGADPIQRTPVRTRSPLGTLVAMAVGVFVAVLFGTSHNPGGLWQLLQGSSSAHSSGLVSTQNPKQLTQMRPQKEAETLLEEAVGHAPGAVEQISSRVDQWRGQVQWTTQIANLTTAALNSNDMRVRESGVEVELAAYGLSKNSKSLEYLLKTAESPDHGQKIWALWALGLMANRGVETEQVVGVLASHLQDSDIDSRRWAVESLALSGSDSAIEILMKTMHDDASPEVRERAACGVASSGLFTPQQRSYAIPKLIEYSDDPSLDAQTHAWAFHALSDITQQKLGNDAAAWRQWYESTKN